MHPRTLFVAFATRSRRSNPNLQGLLGPLEIRGFEPLTYGLQSRRSSHLSYIPAQPVCPCGLYMLRVVFTIRNIQKKGREAEELKRAEFGSVPAGRIPWNLLVPGTLRFLPFGVAPSLAEPDCRKSTRISVFPFMVKGGDPAALSSTATLLRLHPPH